MVAPLDERMHTFFSSARAELKEIIKQTPDNFLIVEGWGAYGYIFSNDYGEIRDIPLIAVSIDPSDDNLIFVLNEEYNDHSYSEVKTLVEEGKCSYSDFGGELLGDFTLYDIVEEVSLDIALHDTIKGFKNVREV